MRARSHGVCQQGSLILIRDRESFDWLHKVSTAQAWVPSEPDFGLRVWGASEHSRKISKGVRARRSAGARRVKVTSVLTTSCARGLIDGLSRDESSHRRALR